MFWQKKSKISHLVAGLGNPGKKYEDTLHNAGFRVIDELSRQCGNETAKKRGSYIYSETVCGDKRVALIQPLTYMNLSGDAVGAALRWYKLAPHDLTVVYDDMDLKPGAIRLRPRGGAGGHKGLASVIKVLNTDLFCRVRIGIGRPLSKDDTKSFVLAGSAEEGDKIASAEKKAAEAVIVLINEGIETAMNKYNINISND